MSIDIIGVAIAGIITTGIAVKAIIDNDKKDILLEKKHIELTDTQNKLIVLNEDLNFSQKKTIKNLEEQTSLQKNIQNKSDEIISLNTKLNEKSDKVSFEIQQQAQLIDKLRNENTKLNQILQHRTVEIYNQLTGGESYLSIKFLSDDKIIYRLVAFIQDKEFDSIGINALKNVSFNIFIDGKFADGAENKDYKTNEEIRLTTTRNSTGIYVLPSDKDYISFGFRFFTINKKYAQLITFKKFTDKKWYMHIKQYEDIYGHLLRSEKYWDDYPESLKKMFIQADIDVKKTFEISGEVRF